MRWYWHMTWVFISIMFICGATIESSTLDRLLCASFGMGGIMFYGLFGLRLKDLVQEKEE